LAKNPGGPPLKTKEIKNISAEIDKIAKGSAAAAGKIQGILAAGEGLSTKLAKQFARVNKDIIKQTNQQETELRKLQARKERGLKIDNENIKATERSIATNKEKIATITKLTDSVDKQSSSLGDLVKSTTVSINFSEILNKVWQNLVKTFKIWEGLQEKIAKGQGDLAMRTGASAAEHARLAGIATSMAPTFGRLEGAVDGLAASFEFVSEIAPALRDMSLVTEPFAKSLLAVSRGLNLGTAGAVELYRTLEGTDPSVGIEEFTGTITRFAASIGGSATVLSKDFLDARGSVASFGRQGMEVFQRTAMMATRFGLETKKILDSMKGFDTFDAASGKVNQLNAMLGTSISSYEVMMEQDPSRRLELFRNNLRDSGAEWENMSRLERMALAQALNLSEEEAGRIFMNNMSLEDMENDRQANADRQARQEARAQSNQEMMNNLLGRTVAIFEGIDRAVERVRNTIARVLGPIFEVINKEAAGLIDSFDKWLKMISEDRDFQKTMRDVADWIKEAAEWLRNNLPTWKQMKEAAGDFWDAAKPIIDRIVPALEWMWDHKEIIAIIFAAAKLAPFISSLSTIGGMIGPGGSLLAGGGAFAGILAGIAAPLVTILAAKEVADEAEASRISEGQAVVAGDWGARRNIADHAANNLRGRAAQYNLGLTDSAIQGSGDSGFGGMMATFAEGVGAVERTLGQREGSLSNGLGRTGQQADTDRNSASSAVKDYLRGGQHSPPQALRWLRTQLSPDMQRAIARQAGKASFADFVNDFYREDEHLARLYGFAPALPDSGIEEEGPNEEASATARSTATAGTASVTENATNITSPATVAEASGPGVGQTLVVTNANVNMDGRKVGEVFIEIARR
jgi:hypothetical protein